MNNEDLRNKLAEEFCKLNSGTSSLESFKIGWDLCCEHISKTNPAVIWTPGMSLNQTQNVIIETAIKFYRTKAEAADKLKIGRATIYTRLKNKKASR